jgi:hypothetical protein
VRARATELFKSSTSNIMIVLQFAVFVNFTIFKLCSITEQMLPPGVDVMITIFCDFRQFLAKKLAFFIKNQCYDQNFT